MPGTNKLTAQREKFAQGVASGLSQSDAYRAAYPKSKKWKDTAVHREASVMAGIPMVSQRIAELAKAVADKVGLTMEKTLREVGRVSYFDPRKLYDDKGNLKNPSEWDDETAAAISHIGRNGPVPFDKNAALEKGMKHFGLFKKDNEQTPPVVVMRGVRSVAFDPFRGRGAAK